MKKSPGQGLKWELPIICVWELQPSFNRTQLSASSMYTQISSTALLLPFGWKLYFIDLAVIHLNIKSHFVRRKHALLILKLFMACWGTCGGLIVSEIGGGTFIRRKNKWKHHHSFMLKICSMRWWIFNLLSNYDHQKEMMRHIQYS